MNQKASRPTLRLLLGINLFWLALSMIFDGLNSLVLPSRLLGQATTLGLITSAGLLAGMLVQPAAGLLSDRLRPTWGRRGTLAVGALLALPGLLLLGVSGSLYLLAASYLLVQVAISLAQAAQQGFIPDRVPPRWRGTASGIKGFMDIGGAMLAFIVLGQLLESGRTGPALWTMAGVLVVVLLLTLLLVREAPAVGAPTRSLAAAFQIDRQQHRAFIWMVMARFLFLLGTYAIGRFLLLFIAERLGLDAGEAAAAAGSILAGLTAITILAAIPAGWMADRFGRLPLMGLGAILSAAGVLLLIVAASGIQILLFGSLMALGSAAFSAGNWAMIADLVPEDEAARFFGLANFGTAGAAAAAGLFGPLIDWTDGVAPGAGYSVLFGVAAATFVASGLALWPGREDGILLRLRGAAHKE